MLDLIFDVYKYLLFVLLIRLRVTKLLQIFIWFLPSKTLILLSTQISLILHKSLVVDEGADRLWISLIIIIFLRFFPRKIEELFIEGNWPLKVLILCLVLGLHMWVAQQLFSILFLPGIFNKGVGESRNWASRSRSWARFWSLVP
jgi:hypothetical protein